jgi:hypothetical protein
MKTLMREVVKWQKDAFDEELSLENLSPFISSLRASLQSEEKGSKKNPPILRVKDMPGGGGGTYLQDR